MAEHKTRFTVWMDPEVLRAAKVRAVERGVTVSEVLAAAAKRDLIDANRQNTDAQILQVVERVFNLIQRIDRRRVYDHQVLKEMLGLSIRSFFNHTPAVPKKDKEAALLSGTVRFNHFLDVLAANLRSGQSILNELPTAEQPPTPARPVKEPGDPIVQAPVFPPQPLMVQSTPPKPLSPAETIAPVVEKKTAAQLKAVPVEEARPKDPRATELPKPTPERKRWSLFQ